MVIDSEEDVIDVVSQKLVTTLNSYTFINLSHSIFVET